MVSFFLHCRPVTGLIQPKRATGAQCQRGILGTPTYHVSLEGFDQVVIAESADVDTNVCATGGKGGIVLPVYIESRGCGMGSRGRTLASTRCAHNLADFDHEQHSQEALFSNMIKSAPV